jgi:hypothetical protein
MPRSRRAAPLLHWPRAQAIVQSFLAFGLRGVRPRAGGWQWEELHELNQRIAWQVGVFGCVCV